MGSGTRRPPVADPFTVVTLALADQVDATHGRPVAGGVRGAVEAVLRTSDPIATLRGLDATLVLDNCEHVIDEAASIAEWLLTEVPGLRIIATSREPLDIPGEILHPVSPLDKATAERLFRERATAVNSTLSAMTPSPDESDPIARICAELDGIPLAIELAAVRLRSMPVSVLVEQLGERLGFRGSRTAPPRHRTLRAVIDWSWEPLSPEERHLLRGLSVFSGGATVEAITRVCGGDVPTLSALVDKSLATLNGDRYTMLETIRAYVREKGDLSPFQHAHAAYYTELAESAEPYLRTGDQLRWLAILDAEQGNLDAALAHTDDPLRLTLARLWPWAMRGRVREARTHAATILKSLPHSHPDATPGTPIAAPAQGSAHVGFSAGTTQEPARSGPLTTSADAPSAPDRTLALSVCRLLLGQQPDAVLRESEHPVALASWALAERIGPPEGSWRWPRAGSSGLAGIRIRGFGLRFGLWEALFASSTGELGWPKSCCFRLWRGSGRRAIGGAWHSRCSGCRWQRRTGAISGRHWSWRKPPNVRRPRSAGWKYCLDRSWHWSGWGGFGG